MEKPMLIEDLGFLFAKETSKKKVRYGMFQCACGNIFKAMTHSIKQGNTQSCGCLLKTKPIEAHGTHLASQSKLYKKWKAMKSRCQDVNHGHYYNYGGRGITLCSEWQSFIEFQQWALSHGYNEGLEIDRIDVNGNYEPENCRWTTRSINQQNKRKLDCNTSGYAGVVYMANRRKPWTSKLQHQGKVFNLHYHFTPEDAARERNAWIILNKTNHRLNPIPLSDEIKKKLQLC